MLLTLTLRLSDEIYNRPPKTESFYIFYNFVFSTVWNEKLFGSLLFSTIFMLAKWLILNKLLIFVGFVVSVKSPTSVTHYTFPITTDRYWSFSSGSPVVLETRSRGACIS